MQKYFAGVKSDKNCTLSVGDNREIVALVHMH